MERVCFFVFFCFVFGVLGKMVGDPMTVQAQIGIGLFNGKNKDEGSEVMLIKKVIRSLETRFTFRDHISLTGELPEDALRAIEKRGIAESVSASGAGSNPPGLEQKNNNASANATNNSQSGNMGRGGAPTVTDTTRKSFWDSVAVPSADVLAPGAVFPEAALSRQAQQNKVKALPPRKAIPRKMVTTAASDYSDVQRKLIRSELLEVFNKVPGDVRIKFQAQLVTIHGVNAFVDAVYFFRPLRVASERIKPYISQPPVPITIKLKKLGGQWLVTDLSDVVGRMKSDIVR